MLGGWLAAPASSRKCLGIEGKFRKQIFVLVAKALDEIYQILRSSRFLLDTSVRTGNLETSILRVVAFWKY